MDTFVVKARSFFVDFHRRRGGLAVCLTTVLGISVLGVIVPTSAEASESDPVTSSVRTLESPSAPMNGVSSFGAARALGPDGPRARNAPVVDMAATPSGNGYWLAASDGGIFTFGDAPFLGSAVTDDPAYPIVGIAVGGNDGYWLASRAGQVFAMGPADFGSVRDFDRDPTKAPTVAIVASGSGGYWLAHGERAPLDIREEGPRVRSAQSRLRSLGYWVGPVDGVFGSLTQQAVFAFQKAEGLRATGSLDRSTQNRLAVAGRPRARSTNGDLLEVDKSRQLVFIVRNGRTLWTFNTSTGTEAPYYFQGERHLADTPVGRFEMLRQIDGVTVAPLGRLYRPKYFTNGGHALHGYSHVPPRPASHGCVRVTNAAIDYIWNNGLVPLGSSVWVYGTSPV